MINEINNEEEYNKALSEADKLIDECNAAIRRGQMDLEKQKELDKLADIIVAYEKIHYKMKGDE